jgi:hypothetical protein
MPCQLQSDKARAMLADGAWWKSHPLSPSLAPEHPFPATPTPMLDPAQPTNAAARTRQHVSGSVSNMALRHMRAQCRTRHVATLADCCLHRHPPCFAPAVYLTSRCTVMRFKWGLYFLSSRRSGVLRRFCVHTQARETGESVHAAALLGRRVESVKATAVLLS